MNTRKPIDQIIDETLNSLDDAHRAEPKPFLFTRIKGRMLAAKENSWERASRFITKPSFAISSLVLVIAFNIIIIAHHHSGNSSAVQFTSATTDAFSVSDVANDDIENTLP